MEYQEFEQEFEYGFECKSLKREKALKEQVIEGYKNKLINELVSGDSPIVHEVVETPKKTFWQKLCAAI